jgi:hypothetical protein
LPRTPHGRRVRACTSACVTFSRRYGRGTAGRDPRCEGALARERAVSPALPRAGQPGASHRT